RAHHHAVAVRAMRAALGLVEFLHGHLAGAHHLGELPRVRARSMALAAVVAVQHRAARDADRGEVDARGPHEERGCRLVAAHQQHDAVERVGADRLLHVHARQVAIEHRGGTKQRFPEGHHRELERETARLPHADLHLLGEGAEMRVAGRELGVGVADADDRTAVELVVGDAAVLHPRAVDVAHLALAPEPLLAAAAFFRCGHAISSSRGGYHAAWSSGLTNLLCCAGDTATYADGRRSSWRAVNEPARLEGE